MPWGSASHFLRDLIHNIPYLSMKWKNNGMDMIHSFIHYIPIEHVLCSRNCIGNVRQSLHSWKFINGESNDEQINIKCTYRM